MVVNFSSQDLGTNDIKEEQVPFMDKVNALLLKLTSISLKDKLFFVQHLGLMLKSGISLARALKTLADQSENKHFQYVLTDIASRVEKGSSFAESLENHRKIFGDLFLSMIDAGELSGKLEEVLKQLFVQMKKEHQLISKVKGAMTYPAVIMIAMIGIGGFMLVFVVPKITAMFAEMDAELPMATKLLIGASDAIRNNGLVTVLVMISIVTAWIKTMQTYRGKFIFQAVLLKAPAFGIIIKKINLARFARNISSLLKTDIMIVKCFQITANVLGNLHYKKALEDMAQVIKQGGKLNEAVKNYPQLFTPVVVQMIAIGEETGELDNILMELAEFYEDEVDQIMENLPTIIEPLLILMLGLGVGGVAVAIVMPMFAITSAI